MNLCYRTFRTEPMQPVFKKKKIKQHYWAIRQELGIHLQMSCGINCCWKDSAAVLLAPTFNDLLIRKIVGIMGKDSKGSVLSHFICHILPCKSIKLWDPWSRVQELINPVMLSSPNKVDLLQQTGGTSADVVCEQSVIIHCLEVRTASAESCNLQPSLLPPPSPPPQTISGLWNHWDVG